MKEREPELGTREREPEPGTREREPENETDSLLVTMQAQTINGFPLECAQWLQPCSQAACMWPGNEAVPQWYYAVCLSHADLVFTIWLSQFGRPLTTTPYLAVAAHVCSRHDMFSVEEHCYDCSDTSPLFRSSFLPVLFQLTITVINTFQYGPFKIQLTINTTN